MPESASSPTQSALPTITLIIVIASIICCVSMIIIPLISILGIYFVYRRLVHGAWLFGGADADENHANDPFPNTRNNAPVTRLASRFIPTLPKFSLVNSSWEFVREDNFIVGRNVRAVVQLRDTKMQNWMSVAEKEAAEKRAARNAAAESKTPRNAGQTADIMQDIILDEVDTAPSAPPSESSPLTAPTITPPEQILVRILSPTEPPQEADVHYTSSGAYDIQFTLMKTGAYTIEVRVKQNDQYLLIGGQNPRHIQIYPGPIDPSQCVMKQFNYQPHLIGEQYTCQIETYDSHGNLRETGGDVHRFSARFANDSRPFTSAIFQDELNGKYSMIYVLTEPGIFELEILYDGHPCFAKQNFLCCAIEPSHQLQLNEMVKLRAGVFQPSTIDDSKRKSVYLRVSSRQISIKKYISLYFVELFPKTLFSSRIHRVKLKYTNPNTLLLKDGIRKIKITDSNALTIAALILKFKFESGETFDDKQAFFKSQLIKDCPPIQSTNVMKFPRDQLLKRSCVFLNRQSSRFWRTYFQFRFDGEEGVDAGGVYREIFNVLCTQLFSTSPPHPSIDSPALFKMYENGYIFFDEAATTPAAKALLQFAGKICAKMLYDHILIPQRGAQLPPVSLSPLFFKHLLQLPVEAEDLQFSSHASLYKHFMEMDLDDESVRDILGDPTFSVESIVMTPTPTGEGGAGSRGSTNNSPRNQTLTSPTPSVHIHNLIPNGSRKPVTNANKELFLGLLAQYELHEKVQPQIDAFLAGFYSVLPPESLTQFDPEDLELLMCGVTEIDVQEMQAHCHLRGGLSQRTSEVQWFWKAVASFPPVQRSKLLGFITGSTSLPAGGFAALNPRLQIQPASGLNSLPRSHTCFHMLDLPRYSSYQRLLQALNTAVEFGSEGFGFA